MFVRPKAEQSFEYSLSKNIGNTFHAQYVFCTSCGIWDNLEDTEAQACVHFRTCTGWATINRPRHISERFFFLSTINKQSVSFIYFLYILSRHSGVTYNLGVESTLELVTRYYFLSESCCVVSVGRPLWREVGSVSCQSLSAIFSPLSKFNLIYILNVTHVLCIYSIYKVFVSPGSVQQIMPHHL
jgi:hypothetical protein